MNLWHECTVDKQGANMSEIKRMFPALRESMLRSKVVLKSRQQSPQYPYGVLDKVLISVEVC